MSRVITFAAAALFALALPATAHAAPVNPVPAPSVTFNGPVYTAAVWGEVIYVAGNFTSANVNGVRYTRQRLAALDRNNGALLNWKPTADNLVVSLAADSGGVYIAGDFGYVNGVRRDNLAKIDLNSGGLHSTFNHRIYGSPKTIAASNGRVYVGGSITSVNGNARTRAAAFSAASGALDAGWAPSINDTVMSVVPSGDRVYLGGRFDSINGAAGTAKVAAVRPDSAAVDTGFTSKVTAMVHDIYVSGATVYAGIDGSGGRATAMELDGNPKWTITTDGDVQAVAELDGTVYLGGHFDNVCRSANVGYKGACLDGNDTRVKLAAVDPNGVLQAWTANGNGSVGVHAIISDPGRGQLIVCGEFTKINGVTQNRFAVFRLSVS